MNLSRTDVRIDSFIASAPTSPVAAVKNPSITMLATIRLPSSSAVEVNGARRNPSSLPFSFTRSLSTTTVASAFTAPPYIS